MEVHNTAPVSAADLDTLIGNALAQADAEDAIRTELRAALVRGDAASVLRLAAQLEGVAMPGDAAPPAASGPSLSLAA